MSDSVDPPVKSKDKTPEISFTLRHPPCAYLHLMVKQLPPSTAVQLDEVTAHSYLRSALSQFLGLTGTAIPLDVLKVEGNDIWLRVAREDASAVVAAVSQWASVGQGISLQIKARGTWLGAVMENADRNLWTMEQ